MKETVYYKRYGWRSVTIFKLGRAKYELEMHDLYQRCYQPFTNIKSARKSANKLLNN